MWQKSDRSLHQTRAINLRVMGRSMAKPGKTLGCGLLDFIINCCYACSCIAVKVICGCGLCGQMDSSAPDTSNASSSAATTSRGSDDSSDDSSSAESSSDDDDSSEDTKRQEEGAGTAANAESMASKQKDGKTEKAQLGKKARSFPFTLPVVNTSPTFHSMHAKTRTMPEWCTRDARKAQGRCS